MVSRNLSVALAISILLAGFPAPSTAQATLSLDGMDVKTRLSSGVPYPVTLKMRTAGGNVQVREACFKWSGEGPFCFDTFSIDDSTGFLSIMLRTGNPNRYKLEGSVVYDSGGKRYRSNWVSKNIRVK